MRATLESVGRRAQDRLIDIDRKRVIDLRQVSQVHLAPREKMGNREMILEAQVERSSFRAGDARVRGTLKSEP